MTGMTETIGALVEPLVASAGLELWDVEQSPAAIRILVDRAGGVDLEQLGPVAQAVSEALDARPDLQPDGRFELEVSSPGVERTLRTPEQYRRFVGSLVAVKTTETIDGSRRFQGILEQADDNSIRLGPEATDTGTGWDFPYSIIKKAHTVFVWGPAPKPGSAARVGAGASRATGRPNPPPMKDIAP